MSTNRPNIFIYSQSMVLAQAAKLNKDQMRRIRQWADAVEARRLARGEDAEDARPTCYQAPVMDSKDVLIGFVSYSI